ncbi:MAG: 2-oxo acid dehydrogenase subunit E2 [Salinivirgaceae bacterium]|nr:2-oxo acid dehydrogenase subunit E2 [Salinivirgaceae bacterium]
MGNIKIVLPAMGEGIFEATITQWLVEEGSKIEEDDSMVEIATDKVDSEIPSPATGILEKILVPAGEIAKIGQEIAILKVEVSANDNVKSTSELALDLDAAVQEPAIESISTVDELVQASIPFKLDNGLFLSPLVRSIAYKEKLSVNDLANIQGTGLGGRITKEDVLNHLHKASQATESVSKPATMVTDSGNPNVSIVEMDRMRKLIADHMVKSVQTSPHVTSFHEVDVTSIVNWRNKNKEKFQSIYGQKLTYTPIFIDAVVKAIKKFPMINVSVDGTKILVKKNVNIGMATALPDGNLIVPVIHNADSLSISGLASKVNDLANRSRNKQLQATEIQGGTFTVTNVGSFGNLSGTPIINQPEVAILALGAIIKRPAVIETEHGDTIGIRHQMILSLSYDHRVVDGSLGGMFIKQVADNLEAFKGENIM